MEAHRKAREIAAAQGGVILRSQAIDLGFTDDQIYYRCRIGDWQPVNGRGYRLFDMPKPLDRVRSAVAVLPAAVASHEAAAELHELPRVRRGIAVVTVHTRTTHDFPGVQVRRAHDLIEDHVATIAGIPVTTIERTVVDLARLLSESHVTDIVEDLLSASRLRPFELREVVRVVARRGRPGSTALHNIVDEYVDGEPMRGSALERRGRVLLAGAGLPAPIPEFPVPWSRSRRFDDAYPDHRVAIEWDSRRWHMRRDAFDADRHRDNEAHRHGWHLYRFTWRDVTVRPRYVIDTVRDSFGRTVG